MNLVARLFDSHLECLHISFNWLAEVARAAVGLNSEAHYVISGDHTVAGAIVKCARDNKADLIVSGGYGHSRLREPFSVVLPATCCVKTCFPCSSSIRKLSHVTTQSRFAYRPLNPRFLGRRVSVD